MAPPPPSYWILLAVAVPVAAVLSTLLFSAGVCFAEGKEFIPFLLLSGLPFGIVIGVLSGLGTAVWAWVITHRVSVQNREVFLTKLQQSARKLNYQPYVQDSTSIVFRPMRAFNWPHNRIVVQIGEGNANISGPWLMVRKLSKDFTG
jgi:hypothetical protein